MGKRIGKQTVLLDNKPRIIATYSIVGPKEGKGPLKDYFDMILKDDLLGKKSYEQAESSMMNRAVCESIKRAHLKDEEINYMLAGDLLNQLSASHFAARDLDVPFIGLYGACSTMTLSLSLGAMLIDGGFANNLVCAASSHFSSAERQFRMPLEMGVQRMPTSQWTVTGAGAFVLGKEGNYPYITHITTGIIKDYGENDPNDMGSAMAPSAVDTIKQHFKDTGRSPKDYDIIATGDLGKLGRAVTAEILNKEYGYNMDRVYIDCGEEIFDCEMQEVNCGGSGCGCSAVVGAGYIYKNIMRGKFKRVLLVSTGALLSTTSSLQGESIPGIAHAVTIEYGGKK